MCVQDNCLNIVLRGRRYYKINEQNGKLLRISTEQRQILLTQAINENRCVYNTKHLIIIRKQGVIQ